MSLQDTTGIMLVSSLTTNMDVSTITSPTTSAEFLFREQILWSNSFENKLKATDIDYQENTVFEKLKKVFEFSLKM